MRIGIVVASFLSAGYWLGAERLPIGLVGGGAMIALFGTLGNSLVAALREEDEREAALVTFLVTASGLSLLGVGAAFWGLVAGVCVRLALRRKRDDDGTGR